MNVCIAGNTWVECIPSEYDKYEFCKDMNILMSFFYLSKKQHLVEYMKCARFAMLDSGVFSVINGTAKIKTEEYIQAYAKFVKSHDIRNYFELDLDICEPLEKIEEYRIELERMIGYPPIPIWHRSRGLKYFTKMAQRYPYVAIAGAGRGKNFSDNFDVKYVQHFVKEAHYYGSKIHGLAFIRFDWLKKIPFDSVDSTYLIQSCAYGNTLFFDKNQKTMKSLRGEKDYKIRIFNSLLEWKKMQKNYENEF